MDDFTDRPLERAQTDDAPPTSRSRMPLVLIAAIAFGWTVFAVVRDGEVPLPIAGSGVIFLCSAFILFCGGALGELAYRLGDVREHEFSGLTQQIRARAITNPRGSA